MSAVALLTAVVLRFKAPPDKLRQSALALYTLLLVTLVALVVNNGLSAAFIGLILTVVLFSGYFQIPGVVLALLVVNGIFAYDYLTNGLASVLTIPIIAILNVPIIISAVLLGRVDSGQAATKEDLAYHELATQLSQVSGKSEVVINAIADGVIALNAKGTIELINPAAQNLIGWGRQDALGLNYRSVLKLINSKNEEPDDMAHPIARVLASNTAEKSEGFSIETSSGKKLLISLAVSPVGQPGAGVIIVFRDITSERAEERQQAEFISTASHEMRTPVASIEGYLGLVLNPATATIDDKARDFITKAHAAAQHLGRLFQDLLDVSKAEDGRLSNNPKVVDVVPFVEEVFEGLSEKAAAKGLRFVFKPTLEDAARDPKSHVTARNLSPVFYANVDNDHLREVVGNLIENAIKYTPSGEVTVDISGDDSKVVISVADTGLGIPKEDQAHLFQKFYRVDNTATREIGGTGLGLYLCRRLAEVMGGRIWLESEFKQGSTFYLEIPRISHDEATRLINAATTMVDNATTQPVAAPPAVPVSAPTPAVPSTAPTVVASPQPVPPVPVTAPQPVPIAPSAQPLPPRLATPVVPTRPNTPLTNIEANPSLYVQPRDGRQPPANQP